MDGWMDELMNQLMEGLMDERWMDRWVDGWMNQWMDGWKILVSTQSRQNPGFMNSVDDRFEPSTTRTACCEHTDSQGQTYVFPPSDI